MENDKEISLVDLLAALVRWRLLVIMPVALALLAAASFFGLKFFIFDPADGERRIEAVAALVPSPGLSQMVEAKTLEEFISRTVADPLYIDQALREAGITKILNLDLSGLEDAGRRFAVRQLFIMHRTLQGARIPSESLSFTHAVERGQLKINFTYVAAEEALRFVRAFVTVLERRMRELSLPFVSAQLDSYERLLTKSVTSEPEDELLATGYVRYTAAKRFLEGEEPSLLSLHDPYLLTFEPSREDLAADFLKKSVLAVFAAGFLGVLLAFAAQAAASVRSDRAAMDKLKDAWYKR